MTADGNAPPGNGDGMGVDADGSPEAVP